MKYSIDGGSTFLDAPNGVRVLVDKVFVPGEDATGEYHLNVTHEGLIHDVWVNRENGEDHNIGTSSITFDEAINALVEANS